MNNLCCLVDAKRKQAWKDKGMIEEHNRKLCMWFEPPCEMQYMWEYVAISVAAERVKMSVSRAQD